MTNNLPWFRVYSEILSDRKITRICARTGQPKYAVIGFWTALLAIANEATVRGLLLIADDIPLDREEIFLECGIDCETGEVLLQEFINLNMIELDEDGIYSICHWENRQFASDNSTERVRRHRERKKEGAGQNGPGTESATPEPEKETPDGNNGSSPLQSNDTPEEMKRFSNVIDSESDTESILNKNNARPRERDFLADIVSHEKGREGVANPADDFTAHFGYRDEALKVCHELTGVYPDTQVGKPAIIALAQEAGFSLDRWRNSIRSARLGGVKANNYQCFIDTYRVGGDYRSLFKQRQSASPRGQPAQSSEPSPVSAAFYAKSRKH